MQYADAKRHAGDVAMAARCEKVLRDDVSGPHPPSDPKANPNLTWKAVLDYVSEVHARMLHTPFATWSQVC